MLRPITGFHQDDVGEWVAELSCLHHQHVRHQPPFFDRAWVLDAAGRDQHVGSELDCPLCDRAELPAGLRRARTAGPFDRETLPPGLRRNHTVADRTWGVLRVLHGDVEFDLETDPPRHVILRAGSQQPIPPGVPHKLVPTPDAVVAVDFMVGPEHGA